MPHIFASDQNRSTASARPAQQTVRDTAPEQALAALQAKADQSSATRQLAQQHAQQNGPVQRIEEEELMQGKAIQRMEEEEMLQGKAIQRMEEDELQGKAVGPALQSKGGNSQADGGMPQGLQNGIEQLSGRDLGHVNVHYNSAEPAAVGAHAFAQGNDIHLASGQEKHLPHEAWHVVQQKEGRVKPTTEVGGKPVNDDASLETEADVMGDKASQLASKENQT